MSIRLAACCYECLTGERPFERESELALVYAHLNDAPPRVTDVRPELPESLDDVIVTALAKQPEDRFASCGELAAAVQAALAGKPYARRSRRRRRAIVATIALLTAAAAGIAAFVSTRGEPGGGSPAITQTSIAGVAARSPEGVLPAAVRRLQGARADGVGARDSQGSRSVSLKSGSTSARTPSSGHHHHVEQRSPDGCRDRPLLDDRRAEAGLRRVRAAESAWTLAGREDGAPVGCRSEPDVRSEQSGNHLSGSAVQRIAPQHARAPSSGLGGLRRRGRDALPF